MGVPLSVPIKPKPKATNQQLQFYWSAPSDGGSPITAYVLECPEFGGYYQVLDQDQRTYTVSGLTNGTPYTFTIKARNANGDGPATPFRTVECGLTSSPPQSATVTRISKTKALVSWNPPSTSGGATLKWYLLKSSSSNPADAVIRESVEPWRTTFTATGLNSASTYTFLVYSINNPGYSAPGVSNELLPLVIIQSGLITWFDAGEYSGTGSWLDKTSNHYDATLENGVIAKNGAGNGVVFNGATNYQFPYIGSLSVWTASIWFKRTGNGIGDAPCLLSEVYAGGSINITIATNYYPATTSQLIGGFFANGWRLGNPVTFPLNEWHCITVLWDGSNVKTYYDGSLNSSLPFSTTSSGGGQPYRIGRRWDNEAYIVGEIGEILIYNRALNDTDVAHNYTVSLGNYYQS